MSRMLEQYNRIKAGLQIKSKSILLFKLGDYYETFYDDAKVINKTLCIPLTRIIDDDEAEIEHCAIKISESEKYIDKLTLAGYEVVILSDK